MEAIASRLEAIATRSKDATSSYCYYLDLYFYFCDFAAQDLAVNDANECTRRGC